MTKWVLRRATLKARTRCEFISGGRVSGIRLCLSNPYSGPNLKLDEPTKLWAAVHSQMVAPKGDGVVVVLA